MGKKPDLIQEKIESLTGIQSFNSPYMAARNEWNERYGSYISSAHTWRLIAILALVIALVTSIGLVYFAVKQPDHIPYIVEVDANKKTKAVYKANPNERHNPDIIRAQMAQFIQSLRLVTTDITLQRAAVDKVYAHLHRGQASHKTVSNWYKNNSPFERAKTLTTSVQITQVLALSKNAWRIEWIEKPMTRDGKALETSQWTGVITVSTNGLVNEKIIIDNPIGIYINSIDISKDLGRTS